MKNEISLRFRLAALLLCTASWGLLAAQNKISGPWVMQSSGTTAKLRGIHAVGGGVAWASGSEGTVLRTEDGGYMWQRCAMPPGAEKLDFRGIWAWDADTAIVMSSGPGDSSRIYKTTDGCSHWKLLFTNPDKDGFWDAMVFGNRKEGAVLGDPVEGRFVILLTFDGGAAWERSMVAGPQADARGEAAFAASNSSLCVFCFAQRAFVTGGAGGPHIFVFYSGPTDSGPIGKKQLPWSSGWSEILQSTVSLAMHPELRTLHYPSGSSAGFFSLAYAPQATNARPMFVAVGGDYAHPSETRGTAVHCELATSNCQVAIKPPHGYRSAVAWDADVKAWIAAGTNGSDISYDDGRTWSPLDDGNWNALSLPWVVGPDGRVAKLDASKLPHK